MKISQAAILLVLLFGAALSFGVSAGPFCGSNEPKDPCSERQAGIPSEIFSKFELPELLGDPWNENNQLMLTGRFREFMECADLVELLVPYDPDNPVHNQMRKAGNTVREDLILFGDQAEYFKYLLPTAKLDKQKIQEAKALLLGPSAYLEFGSGPALSGVITGPRYVFRFSCGEVQAIVSVSKDNLPSIWFSGGGFQPFGGLLHPDEESRWHQLAEEAMRSTSED